MKIAIMQTDSRLSFAPVAWLIKLFSKTNYSHYVMRVEDPASGEVFYYDSSGAGTRKYQPSLFKKKHKLIKAFMVSKEISYIDWLEFWAKHSNKGYAFGQIIGLLLKIFKVIRYNPFGQGAKRLICSELVILFLNDFGYTCIKDTDSLGLTETEEILNKVL